MEQTVLRPKPMPGRRPGEGAVRGAGAARAPLAPRRRGRRVRTVLVALVAGAVLVLAGVGVGVLGATAFGVNRLAGLGSGAGAPQTPGTPAAAGTSSTSGRTPAPAAAQPARQAAPATLGVQAEDARRSGALVVGVHVPGPGYTAGLVRGDVVLALGGTRVGDAAALARAVAAARPGRDTTLTVRHRDGTRQRLTVVPGVLT